MPVKHGRRFEKSHFSNHSGFVRQDAATSWSDLNSERTGREGNALITREPLPHVARINPALERARLYLRFFGRASNGSADRHTIGHIEAHVMRGEKRGRRCYWR